MKKVRVQEIIQENGVATIRVSDMEFGGDSIKTLRIKDTIRDRRGIFLGTILNVTEDDDGKINSVWVEVTMFNGEPEPCEVDDI